MSYDIYGNPLRRGYCEVHPHVNEEYPCSVCMSENNQRNTEAQSQLDHYAKIELEQEYSDLKARITQLEAQLKERDKWIERIIAHGNPVVERVPNTPENHWIYPTISNFNRVLKQAPLAKGQSYE